MAVTYKNFDPTVSTKTWGTELLNYMQTNHTGSDGNITKLGLRSMFRSDIDHLDLTVAAPAPSGTTSTQENLTRDGSILQRMAAHDIYDDGVINGSVFMRTMLNPHGNSDDDFTTGQAKNDLLFMAKMDLEDDGVVNGSSLRNAVRDMWPATNGRALPDNVFNNNVKATTLNITELARSVVPNTTDPITKGNIAADELLKYSFWGHTLVPFLKQNLTMKEIIRLTTNQITPELQAKIDALPTDPTNPANDLRGAVLGFKGIDVPVMNTGNNAALVASMLSDSTTEASLIATLRDNVLTVISRNDAPTPSNSIAPTPSGSIAPTITVDTNGRITVLK